MKFERIQQENTGRCLLQFHDDAPAKGLLITLPGRSMPGVSYSWHQPYFYYLRQVAVQLGYDVLLTEYSFHSSDVDMASITQEQLLAETGKIIRSVLERGYTQLCIAGKSMGTPLAVEHAKRIDAEEKRLILFTPIEDVASKTDEIPTLAIIGTEDYYYNAETIANDMRSNIKWLVMDGLHHGLDIDNDWRGSYTALLEMMTACEDFLR